jgi:hypothetical protein
MEKQGLNDVRPEQYAMIIRELVRHENDVTNHRIMWLLIIQGLFLNAYIPVRMQSSPANGVALAGIVVTLSAFVVLYKSYQARGYLHFLGARAKSGNLTEESLPLDGWPTKRIQGWRRNEWVCPWLPQFPDLFEPYLFLPFFIVATWTFLRWHARIPVNPLLDLIVASVLTSIILFLFCVTWVWSEKKNEVQREGCGPRAPTVSHEPKLTDGEAL